MELDGKGVVNLILLWLAEKTLPNWLTFWKM
jgi:hypothetical protein